MKKFFKKNDGLVTIEWIGVAAVMLVAAITIAMVVMQGSADAGAQLGANVEDMADAATAPPIAPIVPATPD